MFAPDAVSLNVVLPVVLVAGQRTERDTKLEVGLNVRTVFHPDPPLYDTVALVGSAPPFVLFTSNPIETLLYLLVSTTN